MNGHWALGDAYFRTADAAFDRFEFDQGRAEAFLQVQSAGEGILIRDGSTARIPVRGVLTKAPDFFFSIFDGGSGTVYGDIIAAIAEAEADSAISRIVLEIDSPGGMVVGLFDVVSAIAGTSKPIEAEIADIAASAAFAVAAATDRITVNNPMAEVGSIGIQVSQFISESRVTVRSTAAPKKNPDAGTSEGVELIRAELDAVHAEFAGLIARGRGVSVEQVNVNFGQGGMVIAEVALAAGMIDAISESTTPVARRPLEDASAMNLETLRAEHPELYAQAIQIGVDRERDRVSAHVNAGAASPAAGALAASHILSGADYGSQVVRSGYDTAARNVASVDEHAVAVAAATPGAAPVPAQSAAELDDARAKAVFGIVNDNSAYIPAP